MQEENYQNNNLEEASYLKIKERTAFLKKYNRAISNLLIAVGGFLVCFSIFIIVVTLLAVKGKSISEMIAIIIVFFAIFTLPGAIFFLKGMNDRSHILAASYMGFLGSSDRFFLLNLATATQRPVKTVRKDLVMIIKLGILPRASLDESKQYIIFNNFNIPKYQINKTDPSNHIIVETKFGKRTKFIREYTRSSVKISMGFGCFFVVVFMLSLIGALNSEFASAIRIGDIISTEIIFLLLPAIILFFTAANKKKHIRASAYMAIIGENDTFSLQDLASATGKSLNYVKKDMKSIIKHNILPYAKVDDGTDYILFHNVPLLNVQAETISRHRKP